MLKYNKRLPPKFSVPTKYGHTHNVFLDIATRLGLVGLGLFILILFRVFKMGWEMIRQGQDAFIRKWGGGMTACLAALLTAGLFENILTRRIGLIFYIIMAMITILWKLHRAELSAQSQGD
jgi:O-antigen ligase